MVRRLLPFLLLVSACNPELEPIVGDRHAPVRVDTRTWNLDQGLEGFAVTNGVPDAVLTGTVVTWDGADGSPAPGSARLDLPFSDLGQQVSLGLAFDPPLDLRGRVIRVELRLDSGLNVDPTIPGGAQVYAFSGAEYVWANGPWVVLNAPGAWVPAELAIDAPDTAFTGFDGGNIHEFGVMLLSGAYGAHVPAVEHVDSFSIGP
jgi:hypothetical protein